MILHCIFLLPVSSSVFGIRMSKTRAYMSVRHSLITYVGLRLRDARDDLAAQIIGIEYSVGRSLESIADRAFKLFFRQQRALLHIVLLASSLILFELPKLQTLPHLYTSFIEPRCRHIRLRAFLLLSLQYVIYKLVILILRLASKSLIVAWALAGKIIQAQALEFRQVPHIYDKVPFIVKNYTPRLYSLAQSISDGVLGRTRKGSCDYHSQAG